ncbi:Carboxylesterase NlhH [Coccomyxa sp. Obi]|nr:Carboxylesterase NlhH [Coccomyxa sp. Obi]
MASADGTGGRQGVKDIQARRAEVKALMEMFGSPIPLPHESDHEIPGEDGSIPVRVYRTNSEGLLPIMVYYHGGGWCFGSVATHDPVCRAYASACNAVVVSVDYRLAPEYPFPAALDDCYTAAAWVSKHAEEFGGDASTLAVAGDSAGGNLAAAVTLKARGKQNEGGPNIRFQLLVCPVMGYHTPPTKSYEQYGRDSDMPSRKNMVELFRLYVPDEAQAQQPLVCPLMADNLSGLPPALILTAEKDLLRDEGEAYGAKLLDAGVDTCVKRFKGAVHVGMSSSLICTADYNLALQLIKAHWQHVLDCSAALTDSSSAKL